MFSNKRREIMVKIKLLGSLMDEVGFKESTLNLEDGTSVIDVLNEVFHKSDGDQPSYLNVLILVDGVEASTLPHGLNTKTKKGSELIAIPVSHGG